MLSVWRVGLNLIVGLSWAGVLLGFLWLDLVALRCAALVLGVLIPGHGAQVDLYRDNSIAPLFDQRRRLRSVLDVIGAVNSSGFSLARGLELVFEWK